MTKTYSLAYDRNSSMLFAVVPTGEDVLAAAREIAFIGGDAAEFDLITEHGVVLTDDRPDDVKSIVFEAGSHTGYLMDETGAAFRYAVRA